jgi:hypothetical protein
MVDDAAVTSKYIYSIGLLVNEELERIWKEGVLVEFLLLLTTLCYVPDGKCKVVPVLNSLSTMPWRHGGVEV